MGDLAGTATSTRPHGYARYRLDSCRCYVCARAVSDYDLNRSKKLAAGTWQPFVDAQLVREHLQKLAAAGISSKRTGVVAGVSSESIAAILGRRNRPATKVRVETARRILALDPTAVTPAAGSLVDATGSIRRIQALCRLGWPISAQERVAGCGRTFQQILARTRITAANAALVRRAYDELSMTPAPAGRYATQARNMAQANGWPPPLAWDDDDIDNPAAAPAATPTSGAGPLADWVLTYQAAKATGLNQKDIAGQLGITVAAVKDRLRRARAAGLLPTVEKTLQPCGTWAAHTRHSKRGEPIDDACRAAARARYQPIGAAARSAAPGRTA